MTKTASVRARTACSPTHTDPERPLRRGAPGLTRCFGVAGVKPAPCFTFRRSARPTQSSTPLRTTVVARANKSGEAIVSLDVCRTAIRVTSTLSWSRIPMRQRRMRRPRHHRLPSCGDLTCRRGYPSQVVDHRATEVPARLELVEDRVEVATARRRARCGSSRGRPRRGRRAHACPARCRPPSR